MDNSFLSKPHPGARRPLSRRVSRVWIIGFFLFLGVTKAPPQSQPSIAPEGEFLPNDPYILPNPPVFKLFGLAPPQLPPPEYTKYETRLGWLMGANTDYYAQSIQAESTEQDYAMAARKEMEKIVRLKGEPRQDYLFRLIRDIGTLEMADFNNRGTGRIAKAALFDFMMGGAGSTALESASVEGLIKFATDGMTSGISDFLAQYRKKQLRASDARMAALRLYFSDRCGCPFPMKGRFRPPQAWDLAIPPVRGRYQTTLARLLASGGKTMSRLWDRRQFYADQEAQRLLKLRNEKPQEFAAYMVNFCYDLETLQQELLDDQKVSWDVSIMTSVGLGVAASIAGAALAGVPAAASALSVPLNATRIPILEKAMRGVLTAYNVVKTLSPGAALSASYSAWSEYESFSGEKQVHVGIDALRRIALEGIRQIPGDCGCSEKAKPRKSAKPPAVKFTEGDKEGYWLVGSGGMLDIDYGEKGHIIAKHGREYVLAGPIRGTRGDAVKVFCGQISNPRWDPSSLNRGFYGEFRGETYNIGRLGGCGVKGDE